VSVARYWAVVPAAGIGARMQSEVYGNRPKQYLSLADKTIIEHSISKLLQIECLEKVAVSLHADDAHWARLPLAADPRLMTVEGGRERCDSVLNGLQALSPWAQANDWVLVHDAARPCVTVDAIQKLIAGVRDHEVGGILGVPVSDTIKRADGKVISATVDRRFLWQAHTPQIFRYGLLKESLERALANQFAVTDEASALEFSAYQALLVEDRRDNIKVTRPEDLAMAEAILAYQSELMNRKPGE